MKGDRNKFEVIIEQLEGMHLEFATLALMMVDSNSKTRQELDNIATAQHDMKEMLDQKLQERK